MAVLLSAAISVGPVAFTPLAGLLPQAVAASLTLAPNSGEPGTPVTVTGDGFTSPCSPVTITFDGKHAVQGTANPPQISGSITVPADATPGPHKIGAFCKPPVDSGGSYFAAATFTVTGSAEEKSPGTGSGEETPELSLDKSEGPPKTPFTVSGSGFDKCDEDVELYAGEKKLVDELVSVSEQGNFSREAEVFEGTPPGTYQIRAVCVGYPEIEASAPFTVTEAATADPQLSLSKSEGEKGTTVQADGTGFTCEDVELIWKDGAVLTPPVTVTDGGFSTEIIIPADAQPGAYSVRAVCNAYPEQAAEAPFTVTATPTENGGNENGGNENGGNENGGNENGGNENGGNENGGNENGGNENGGNENGGNENGGNENGGNENGGNQNGGNENGGTENGGNQNGGTTGGDGGDSATPVGLIIGPASLGGALAIAVAAGAYFGRLHRGPRWVRNHVKATLRPVAGTTGLTEERRPGEPPTHTTRLDPHPDPGRQTIEGPGGPPEEER